MTQFCTGAFVNFRFLLLTSCLLLPFSTWSEEVDLFSLNLEQLLQLKVVSSATGFKQSLSDASATAHVVTREEWENAGARALVDVLRMVPGVHVTKTQTGLTTNTPEIRGISGSFGQQVLILIDGKPLKYQQSSGRFTGQRLPLNAYARIEVVKSPGSVVYGADAVGGIINLVTAKVQKESLTLRKGSHDITDIAFNFSAPYGEATIGASLAYQHSNDDDGKTIERDLQTTFDEVFGTTASKAPGKLDEQYKVIDIHAFFDWRNVSYSGHFLGNSESGLGAGVAQALDPTGFHKTQHIRHNLDVDLISKTNQNLTWHNSYSKQHIHTRLRVFPAGTVLPIGDDGNVNFTAPAGLVAFPDGYIGTPGSDSKSISTSLEFTSQELTNHHIRVEIGYEKQFFDTQESKNFGPGIIDGSVTPITGDLTNVSDTEYVYIPDQTRELLFASILDQWQVRNDWTATLGVRVDDYSDFGSSVNPRASLQWNASEQWQFKAFVGKAFRAPAFVELYARNNPAGLGNENVESEKATTSELGADVRFSASPDLELGVAMYRYQIKDIIEFVAEQDSGIQVAQNNGEQEGYGAELELSWLANDFSRYKAHYTYLHSQDKDGNPTPDVVKNMAYIEGQWRLNERWRWYLDTKWIGARDRATSDSRSKLPSYATTNTRVSFQPSHNIETSVLLTNVFDKQAREPSNGSLPNDYPLAGRSLIFAIDFQL